MSKKIDNLRDLLIEQGRELYDTSRQEQKELPNIHKRANNQELKKIINNQLETSKNQSDRIQEAFNTLGESPKGEKNDCCKSVIKQTKKLINRSKDSAVRDAVIINSIQRLGHDKISSLGALTSYAKQIGEKEIADSFYEILSEEKTIDKELSKLAKSEVNKKALTIDMLM